MHQDLIEALLFHRGFFFAYKNAKILDASINYRRNRDCGLIIVAWVVLVQCYGVARVFGVVVRWSLTK